MAKGQYQRTKNLNPAHLNIRKSIEQKEAQKEQAKYALATWAAPAQVRLLTRCDVLFVNYKEMYDLIWKFILEDNNLEAAQLKERCVGMALEVAIRKKESFSSLDEIIKKADEYYQVLFPSKETEGVDEKPKIETP